MTVLYCTASAWLSCRVPPLRVVVPVKVLGPASTWVPLPLMTRLIVPKPLPPAITPLKVVVPPVAPRVSVDGSKTLLLSTCPPLPGVKSDRELTCWLFPPRFKVALEAMETGVAIGSMLLKLEPLIVTRSIRAVLSPLFETVVTHEGQGVGAGRRHKPGGGLQRPQAGRARVGAAQGRAVEKDLDVVAVAGAFGFLEVDDVNILRREGNDLAHDSIMAIRVARAVGFGGLEESGLIAVRGIGGHEGATVGRDARIAAEIPSARGQQGLIIGLVGFAPVPDADLRVLEAGVAHRAEAAAGANWSVPPLTAVAPP